MSFAAEHKKSEYRDRRNSAVITALLSALVFLTIFFYQFTTVTYKPEEITTMLINFGDQQEGATEEEPADQEGSISAAPETAVPEPVQQTVTEPEPKVQTPQPVVKEKMITGKSANTTTPTPETQKNTKPKATTPKTAVAKPTTSTGDGRGNAAIGNLIKGRGTKNTTQGTTGTTGNQGDPLGGDGNGDSKIGVDRNLIGFIPGTMGRGGAQPSHNCSASGTIHISYTVDKAGNVISARRSGGISDHCVTSTSVSWVKQYVKAERAATSSTGTYRITF
ncbi:ferric siderophore ABC transporter substrate-binding protein [Chryseobacterium sp. 6424]|uniref:ferric siderophore ABC transporter substrate-binding protein n=1 Tax=Chryseobacterium sp. 6424 TaxID=2039166 RepID=UPI000EFC03ED|nr:ferric siderophore ABC transporter substrate-binding protein [Chryseobacterium sp. 6424]AYO56713.1 ferric siderophore ABC transporter substrate-binding protein [Chryseobacterium sp. 6424]